MGKDSNIEWTHHTFNPWWGCEKVSPGCAHCYAETFSKRTGHEVWGAESPRRMFGVKHWSEPLRWNRDAESLGVRQRVFCASMADVFEDRVDLVEPRTKLFDVIESTPCLDWLLLTKRPQNIAHLLPKPSMSNVWLGTSAEDQTRWDERLPLLLSVPSVVHFVSAEPLLGPISMGALRPDWLIVGGESGHKARPMQHEWVEDLCRQCDRRTAFFFKQWGGINKRATGRELDGRTWDEIPLASVKGLSNV